jgi:hypothetical protein
MAYELNGTNQRLNTTSSPVSGTPLSVACWFNADNNTTNQRLVDLRQTTDVNAYFSIGLGGAVAGDPLRMIVQKSGNAQITTTTTGYSINTWHHACGVFTTSANRTIYLDAGGSATSTTDVGSIVPVRIDIGVVTDNDNILAQFFDGRIAEVGIWNAALTAAEIASLAKGMTCDKVRPQNLVFYAPLIRDLVDTKGGLTITNNNSATVANHPRVYA